MKMNKEQIKKFCEENPTLVSVKQTLNPELRVLKYKNRVFYKSLWTPELLEMRGTVIDKDWNVVSRPFTKIFNYGEKKAPRFHNHYDVIASQKVNGFMAAATVYNDDLLVSTTGTIDSEFADLARTHLEPYKNAIVNNAAQGVTWLFEIVDAGDPHIIPEEEGAYLLNIRDNSWNAPQRCVDEMRLDLIAHNTGFKRPSWKRTTWKKIKDEMPTCTHEGYVIYSTDRGIELKIKSPLYLVTKFLGRMGDKNVDLLWDDPDKFIKMIDEEFYLLVPWLTENHTKEEYLAMDKQARIDLVRAYVEQIYESNEAMDKLVAQSQELGLYD